MNLRARRQEEGITPPEERPEHWIAWPALVRRAGAWFCGLILFSFALGILGLRLRTGFVVAGASLGAVYLVARARRGRP